MPQLCSIGAASARGFGLTEETGGSVLTDDQFNLTTLLLPGNGTNGAQNNTFQDSSTNNFTVTRNGNTTQGTFSPFSQTGWSNYFDGVSDSLTFATSTALSLSGAFTIEFWIFLESLAVDGVQPSIITFPAQPNGWQVYINSAGSYIALYDGNADVVNTFSSSITANRWYHVAISRDASNNLAIFLDGVRKGSTASGAGTIGSTTGTIRFMAYDGNQGDVKGYLSNLRIVKGSAVYNPTQSTLTVPTTALTAVSNTQLLICQSNRFVDNANQFNITVNGNVSVQPFSPFQPDAAYSAGTVGGSGYFDGSGDYLSVPDNAVFDYGTGSLTVEAWIYTGIKTDYQNIIGSFDGFVGWYIHTNSGGTITYGLSASLPYTGSRQVCDNAWHHVAMVRNGSTNLRLYVDGVLDNSQTDGTNVVTATEVRIGSLSGALPRLFTGYIASLRVVKGTAVYTTAFTPPTAPVTAITNTGLLLNYTNGGIIDATAKNVLETVGNAQISTAQSKFGGSSMYFDGSGDYLVAPAQELTSLTGNFTVEFWAYRPSSGNNFFYTTGDDALSSGISIYIGNSGNNLRVYNANGVVIDAALSGISFPTLTWTHIALVRSSGVVKLFAAGSQAGSNWSSSTTFSGRVYLATEFNNGSTSGTGNCYLQDFRITKGYARYTSNFTPPTAAFPLL
jgi:hypothetical protein